MSSNDSVTQDKIAFSLERNQFLFSVPGGVKIRNPHPLLEEQDFSGRPFQEARDRIQKALENPISGASLTERVEGVRHVLLLVGDLTVPGPYHLLLPNLCVALVEAGIRPSRISLRCCPGIWDRVLGLLPIRRFGEEVAGTHEIQPWILDGDDSASSKDPMVSRSDLTIAVFPDLPGIADILPPAKQVSIDWALGFSSGCQPRQEVSAVKAGSVTDVFTKPKVEKVLSSEASEKETAYLLGSGGYPSDATLEEALAGLRWMGTEAIGVNATLNTSNTSDTSRPSVVLAFGGFMGLGSAAFTLDLWKKLEALEKEFSEAGPVNKDADTGLGLDADPLEWLLHMVRYGRVILFAPGLLKHAEWNELCEFLSSLPEVSRRCTVLSQESEMWELLGTRHGEAYDLVVEPLGWRAHGNS